MGRNVFVVDALRTPIGRLRGALSSVRPDDLAAQVIRALLERTRIEPERIDDVIFGAANQSGEDNRNVARMAALLAGLPVEVPGVTVNRLCGSSLDAIIRGAHAIACGEADAIIVGGVESMSRAPYVLPKSDVALGREQRLFDTVLGWRMVNPNMPKAWTISLGETAELVAQRYGITRAAQDAFAYESQHKCRIAQENKRFDDELVPIRVGAGASERIISQDEHPRAQTTHESLAALASAFIPDGSVTAGNSSGMNDGAAALLLCDDATLARLGCAPLGRFVASAVVGVAPEVMGLGPIPATRRALARAGIRLRDLARAEINEAFASQALACVRELALDPAGVNVNGGAIALGHPLGASGARIATTLLHELRRSGGRYGLASMCIGVGQGIAAVFENIAAS